MEGAGGLRGAPVMAATKDATASLDGGGPLLAFRCFAFASFLQSCVALCCCRSASCLVSMLVSVVSVQSAFQFSIVLPYL